MNLRTMITVAAMSGAVLPFPALAQGLQSEFASLRGVEARALSADEMHAVSGKLNAYDMAANREALAAQLDAYPRLQAAVLRRADFIATNAELINAALAQRGLLTPCQSCAR